MDDSKIVVRSPVAAVDKAVTFSMRNLPLLEQGTTYDPLATAENLWVSVKVYASGGENALHAHDGEDHSFIVLQGKATFTFGDGRTEQVGIHQGVMIPRGVEYRFEADEAENLVMMRVGGGERKVKGLEHISRVGTPRDVMQQTRFSDGSTKVGDDPRNGETSKKRIYAQGKFFSPE